MNKEEILAMKAGKGLDVLIADKVMEWEVHEGYAISENGVLRTWEETSYKGFSPSINISAAWEVVEKFYYSDIRKLNGCNWGAWVGRGDGHSSNVTSVTAPLAICKCALLAVME